MPITAERFAQGLLFEQYMLQMEENQDAFATNYAEAELDPDDMAFITNSGMPLNVLVLTEDWCSDSLVYLPVLARLADCTDSWDLRIFLRDQNPDLVDEFKESNQQNLIPVFAFLDEDMRELALFVERPALANEERQELVDQLAASNPTIVAGTLPREQSEEAWEVFREPLRQLRETRTKAWQKAAIDEIRDALQKVSVARTLAEH